MRLNKVNLLILFIFLSGFGCPAAQKALAPGATGGQTMGVGAGATGESPSGSPSGSTASAENDEAAPDAPGAGNVPPPSSEATAPVSHTPITIVNAPMANIPAAQPCALAGVTLCFSGVVVEAIGSDGDRPKYQITGTLNKKSNANGTLTGVGMAKIFLQDLDFPQSPYLSLAAEAHDDGAFVVTFLSMPGHKVELAGPVCNRRAILDLEVPDPSSPIHFNTCASSDPSDTSTPPPIQHHQMESVDKLERAVR